MIAHFGWPPTEYATTIPQLVHGIRMIMSRRSHFTQGIDPMIDGSEDSAILDYDDEWPNAVTNAPLDFGMVYNWEPTNTLAGFADFDTGILPGSLTLNTEAYPLESSGYPNALGSPGSST